MNNTKILVATVVLLCMSAVAVPMVSAGTADNLRMIEPTKVSFMKPTDLIQTYTPNFLGSVGTGISTIQTGHTFWKLNQIGTGKISYQEAPFPVRHLSWSIDKLYPAGYHKPLESTYKPFDIKISDPFGTTSLKGFRHEKITRASTAPGLIGRFGYDPLTDSITKTVTQQMKIHSSNTPGISSYRLPSYSKPSSFSSYSNYRPSSFGSYSSYSSYRVPSYSTSSSFGSLSR